MDAKKYEYFKKRILNCVVWPRGLEDMGRNMPIGFGGLEVISNFDEPVSWNGRGGSQI